MGPASSWAPVHPSDDEAIEAEAHDREGEREGGRDQAPHRPPAQGSFWGQGGGQGELRSDWSPLPLFLNKSEQGKISKRKW